VTSACAFIKHCWNNNTDVHSTAALDDVSQAELNNTIESSEQRFVMIKVARLWQEPWQLAANLDKVKAMNHPTQINVSFRI